MASQHDMTRAKKHLMEHHKGNADHHRAHGGGEKVHFSGGKPGHGHNETPGSPREGKKLTREEED